MEEKSFSTSINPRRNSSQSNSFPFFSPASLAIISSTGQRKRRAISPLHFTAICMPVIFLERAISVFLQAQEPPLPLPLHMPVVTSQQVTFYLTEFLYTSSLSHRAKSFWNIPKLAVKDCNGESECSDNINVWKKLHKFRYRNMIAMKKRGY